ncbi:hypothetical protein [Alloyangia pacifica]|uniref:DnaA N-terminal domain-containing protein n=1 Tax=Alloyangia pacifica TaxID=311180 RepID=A0A1I6V0M4_9RHOB|nr:hypothetical protein [Alloyangia pacifica]SDI33346.1 hypothetical protein SAMN04488245_114136 [Alloyangia pacifica]SFT07213.1 hypothetical protein SAMN04488050_109185 [Alloyangia pacifica]
MLATKAVGRNASALKYDLLTVMGAFALAQEKGRQVLVLRLMTLVTARYNWARDELAVGQREIARLWMVDERTVKREMAKLRAMGWLRVKRQGARGRVSEYSLAIDRILEDSRGRWADVGPDFELRLSGSEAEAPDEKVVPLPVKGKIPAPDLADETEWGMAKALLHAEDPALYAAWVAALRRVERAGGRLVLEAPTRFHASYVASHLTGRLLSLCRGVDEGIDEIRVIA